MFLHQVHNSISGDVYNAYSYTAAEYAPHFHKSYELAYVAKGSAEYQIGSEQRHLGAGDFALVSPYALHSFVVDGESEMWVVVFANSYVKTFSKLLSDTVGETAFFTCEESTRHFFEEHMTMYHKGEVADIKSDEQLLMVKACLYAVCSEYIRTVKRIPKSKNSDVLVQILEYVSQNFQEDISLQSIARALGYNYQYLSKIFNRTMNINFKTLVNHYRFEYARQQLLNNPEKSISEIAFESGFQSIRSFNRIYREISGSTPNQSQRIP
ncbi:MAG: helix-turn-helix transcriptional regulator [Clostridia bacterium]|nr:helix-turn-helix transcriptional regulator [Clostridia bacterium]